MDNLDIGDSLPSSFPWLPYGASQFSECQVNGDLGYLSQRSAMLEPIMEETSDDDDVSGGGHVWTHHDNQWSSESETGSVIRVEVIQDTDTISERDFACPPKRRKQEDNDEDVVLRRSALNDDYKYRIDLLDPPTPQNSDPFSKRFCVDTTNYDRFSDPDSLSFNSLSRSSSLIQFESLERQMQTGDAQSSFGGSSPSLNSLATNQETAGSKVEFITASPKSNENECDVSSVRNYYDIDKINFNSQLFLNCQEQSSSSESSCSTDNSIYYSDNQPENENAVAKQNLQCATVQNAKMAFRNKNSVENLSEDSGYGEFPSIKCRSKSIPILNQDQLIEEDEEMDNHRSLNNLSDRGICKMSTKTNTNSSYNNSTNAQITGIHSKCQNKFNGCSSNRANSSKINSTAHFESQQRSVENPISFGISKNSGAHNEHSWNEDSSHVFSSTHTNPMNGITSSKKLTSLQTTSSTSLPDISVHCEEINDTTIFICNTSIAGRSSKRNTVCGSLLYESVSFSQKDSFIVTSVPIDLDLLSTEGCSEAENSWESRSNRGHDWQEPALNSESVANKNFDLAQAFCEVEHSFVPTPAAQQTYQQQKVINSSYNNLTLLDYSGARKSFGNQLRMMADKQKRNSVSSSNRSSTGSTEFSKCNFLLDEISAHFDRSLSILNDRMDADDEIDAGQVPEAKEIIEKPLVPQPPPRKQFAQKYPNTSGSNSSLTKRTELSDPKHTFDQDPTNLKTCYADSLEQCNFDLTESSNSINLMDKSPRNEQPRTFSPTKCSIPVKREFIASTPNLSLNNNDTSEEFLHTSSAYNSLNQVPQTDAPVQTKSILSAGSRNSLGKGVSFYPYVSEISWHEQSSAETADGNSDGENSDINSMKFTSDTSNSTNITSMVGSTSNEAGERIQKQIQSDTLNRNDVIVTHTNASVKVNETHERQRCQQYNSASKLNSNSTSDIESDDDDLHYETQPRSLAALAERDRRREQLYLQKLAKMKQQEQHRKSTKTTSTTTNNANNNEVVVTSTSKDPDTLVHSNAVDISTAMIVNENRVSYENNANRNNNNNSSQRIYDGDDECDLSAQQYLKHKQITKPERKFLPNNCNNNETLKTNQNLILTSKNNSPTNYSVVYSDSQKINNYNSNNNNNNNNNNNRKMEHQKSRVGNISAINVPVSSPVTGEREREREMLSTNSNLTFDKKHKAGFLSRFTNFRFSLRGSKKKLKPFENTSVVPMSAPSSNQNNNIVLLSKKNLTNADNAPPVQPTTNQVQMRKRNNNNNNNNNNSRNGIPQRNSMRSNEFEYIPLKDPVIAVFDNNASNQISDKQVSSMANHNNNNKNQQIPVNNKNGAKYVKNDNNNIPGADKRSVLSGKPPLPKQPPRVVGVCAKHNLNATYPNYLGDKAATLAQSTPHRNGEGVKRHAHHEQRSTSAPREIDNHYLANDYNDMGYQLRSSRQTNETHSRGGLLKGAVSSDGLLMDTNETNSFCGDDDGGDEDDEKIGLIETNLDTDETIISGKTRSLMELGPQIGNRSSIIAVNRRSGKHGGNNGNAESNIEPRRPHKSMEFLLDKENQRFVLPPENELQKSHDNNTNLSEHQLRVQASLQRLNVPDWFKQYNNSAQKTNENGGSYVPGSFTKKRNADAQRWAGLNSKTTSLSSLGSHRSDRSPLLLSPSAHSHHGNTGFSRWSTSHLNSSQTSPSASTRCSFSRGGPNSSILSNQSYISGNQSIRGSFRQPYLGWRSQEKLSQPRTPHERLASSMLSRQQAKQQSTPNNKNSLSAKTPNDTAVSPEIQSSIKEVTSAIVHFVNDQNNRVTNANSRSRSTSPSSKKCWLESSFVGNKPMDSPQTPVLDTSFSGRDSALGLPNASARVNGIDSPIPPVFSIQNDRSSRGSATLEDVLASLLGLPSEYRSSGDLNTRNDMNSVTVQHLKIDAQPLRRRSEGDASKRNDSAPPDNNNVSAAQQRRISLDSTESKSATIGVSSTTVSVGDMIRCRNPKCEASATLADAKRSYKCCHNCSQMYCSRDCRRAHWEKHRKACLHSRVSVLCRQVLSTCKDDNDTLLNLSVLARRGFISQGRGVARILFRSPESAENFVKQGFQRMGEASYVRWPELMPQEMGPELYSELLRLSTEYKPESKMLIYVAICVVSEAPSNATASVKWERQLVSRCAKLKLSKSIPNDLIGNGNASGSGIGNNMNTVQPNRIQNLTATTTADDLLATTSSAIESNKVYTDVLILTFNFNEKSVNTQKNRELILLNMQCALKKRGVSLRKHYPEIYQRLHSFVEGTTDRFMPVTLHPRDAATGQPFICIMMPNLGQSERIKLPESENGNVITIDCLDVDQFTRIE